MTITPEDRIASAGHQPATGGVTLMNGFVVAPEQDAEFHEAWYETSRYFIEQPGFVSLRLHRALSPTAPHRWVNVANWESEAEFRAAHSTAEFRRLVSQQKWQAFPSSPVLFEIVTTEGETAG
jgi:heme-degrading monooxygenase HmoA